MEQFDRELRHMAGEEPFEVPDCVHQKMADTLAALPEKKAKTIPLRRRSHLAAMAACAALLLLVVLLYRQLTTTVRRIDLYRSCLVLPDGPDIPIADLLKLEGELFRELE